ncbi:3-hydroxyacyl-CoA dehydrogenase NAD-binding domain-containing protein [Coralliovum pocilloporae]|uniref:3-hydroxyacyl-CoA dehydrogenase NAD-binding domain-containing protein n=1 Tax=Coralliovum pocilloporae TaxID=3066369 RepID=UPI003306C278
MTEIKTTAVLGAGVIGASWTALFTAAGLDVQVYDPSSTAEQDVLAYVDRAWDTLLELGLAVEGRKGGIRFLKTAAEAVQGAQFIQENVPERLDIKHATFAEIEPVLSDGAIVSSSASGLMLKEMQQGWKNPARLILGHPFNPPHLIPLVELLANDATDADVLERAEAFYTAVGKTTIRLHKEVPGHVANRLQAALWREAIHLIREGVASVEDVDKAVWAGPGLRWAAMGPTMLFHLGAGEGGLEAFCDRYSDSFNRWWDDLGDPRLSGEVSEILCNGVIAEADGKSSVALSQHRDRMITDMLRAKRA